MEERKYTPKEIKAIKGAKAIEEYCGSIDCSSCIFQKENNRSIGCELMDFAQAPADWELPELLKQEAPATPEVKNDNVNHPGHYTAGGVECIDAIEAATVNLTGIEAVCTGNVIKYVWRWKLKNGIEDLKKAAWYLHKLIKKLDPTWRAGE